MPDKNKLILGTNDDTYIAADDAGNIVLQHEGGNRVSVTNNAITPATDEQIDLGSATNKFKDLYLSSDSIYIGNTKVSSDPSTGALSTVVADAQGQFTGSAAPVGGASGPFDWEATGFTHIPPRLANILTTGSTGNATVDALYDKFNQIGNGTNFLDPIAIWNLTRGASPILDPSIHINGNGGFGGQDNENFFQPSASQNFQLHEMGYTNPSPSPGILGVDFGGSGQEQYLLTPAEIDAHSTRQFPVMLFKDENNEYFKDFLAKTMLEHKLLEMVVSFEYEVIYTCSNSTTAAATPFFENTDADSDGLHRRTFTTMKFPEMMIRRRDRFVPLANGGYNWGAGRAFPNDITASENYDTRQLYEAEQPYYDSFATNLFTRGANGEGLKTGPSSVTNTLTKNSTTAYSTVGLSPFGRGDIDKRQANGEYYVGNMKNKSLVESYWSLTKLRWSGDFFENGNCFHSDYPTPGSTLARENAGRGCEVKLRVKIK